MDGSRPLLSRLFLGRLLSLLVISGRLLARLRLGFTFLRRRQVYSCPPSFREADRDRLFCRTGSAFTLSDVIHFFANKSSRRKIPEWFCTLRSVAAFRPRRAGYTAPMNLSRFAGSAFSNRSNRSSTSKARLQPRIAELVCHELLQHGTWFANVTTRSHRAPKG